MEPAAKRQRLFESVGIQKLSLSFASGYGQSSSDDLILLEVPAAVYDAFEADLAGDR